MTLSISNFTVSPQIFSPSNKEPSLSLKSIRSAEGNILEIVKLLNENKKNCLELFRRAVKEEDSISQIQLSQAYFEIQWREKESKNSVSKQTEEFYPFYYYPRNFELFTATYHEAMQCTPNDEIDYQIAKKIFSHAADAGYLPATLERIATTWKNHTTSYGFAVQVRPFVNKGNQVIDYYFGQALKHGSSPGSTLFYEGLYWMYKSKGISVQFPDKNESFENFTYRYYLSPERKSDSYYEQDGFVHPNEGSAILAPSKEKWETFVKEKIETVKITPEEYHTFSYNEKEITSLVAKNIGGVCCDRFEASPDGLDIGRNGKKEIPGFFIHSLSLYEGGKHLGTISVRKNNSEANKHPFVVCETIADEKIKTKIQPILELVENVMIRTGSPSSANEWLGYLANKNYLSSTRHKKDILSKPKNFLEGTIKDKKFYIF